MLKFTMYNINFCSCEHDFLDRSLSGECTNHFVFECHALMVHGELIMRPNKLKKCFLLKVKKLIRFVRSKLN